MLIMQTGRGIFITGSDTAVGKTVVTALLLVWLRARGVKAAAMKPIACGDGRRDAEIFWELAGREMPLSVVNPVWLKHPLAPMVAARLERRKINREKIRTSYQQMAANYRVILVEGAGGLLVPIARKYCVADLAKELALPLLIVTGNRLGALNHTLAAVECAQRRGLKVDGIVLNKLSAGPRDLAQRTNAAALRSLTGLPVAELPFLGEAFLRRIQAQKALRIEDMPPRIRRLLKKSLAS